jgi:catechol 2,3-dioxygenase-like lactoylglutathione lyase family enzyme
MNMAVIGAHVLLYSTQPDALRALLRDAFGWRHVDAGQGWLIFALPPAEIAVHPADGSAPHHELSLMCDDIARTIADLRAKGVVVKGEPQDRGWGIAVPLALPGGVDVLLYQPRHRVAIESRPRARTRVPRERRRTKRAAKARR